jgi:hypothetical protein
LADVRRRPDRELHRRRRSLKLAILQELDHVEHQEQADLSRRDHGLVPISHIFRTP